MAHALPHPQHLLTSPQAAPALLALTAAILALALGPLVLFDHPRAGPVDFHHIWTAGKMWAAGQSPYLDARESLFALYQLPHVYDLPAPFFYPPHTIVLFAPLGFLSPGPASVALSLTSLLALAASSVVAADILRAAGVRGARLSLACLHALFLTLAWNATAIIFFHNIATIILYLAILLLLRGAQTGRFAPTATGTFFALMAPQIGAGAVIGALLLRRTRVAALAGAAAVAAASLAGLAPGGIAPSLHAFLGNLAAYAAYPANSPFDQSGAGYFAGALLGQSWPSGALLPACGATLAGLAALSMRDGETEDARAVEFLALAAVAGVFFLPSLRHYYIVAAPAVLLLILRRGPWLFLALPGAALLMRSLDIFVARQALGLWPEAGAALVDSVAILLLFAAALWRWTDGRTLRPARAIRMAIRPGGRSGERVDPPFDHLEPALEHVEEHRPGDQGDEGEKRDGDGR